MGVCSHSQPSFWDEHSIFSIHGAASAQTRTDFKVFCDDHGIGFKPLEGCYRGAKEFSFIVNKRNLPIIKEHGWLEGEETILHLTGMQRIGQRHAFARHAQLEWLDTGQIDFLGWYVACNKNVALSKEAWTHDPSDDTYWITKKGYAHA